MRGAAGGSWLPQPEGWRELSVEVQTGEPDSTLDLYRTMLAVRREQPDQARPGRQW
ncbi:hypothetical protein E0500_031775 [Streptomyces sp. KM273126]|uniref:hypothetical protein n=1 Tax=Streptomyces sp. KM273126 TaxID=2545247 RepID=UPI00140472A5|nr:hypothetical protein [Streptomyces sp. KM273126]MBA2811777.1 hypothetical protein [Streptomyces sp. KM273126]